MAVIKQHDWEPPVTTTFPTLQKLKQNPDGPYRELLMADDGNGNPVPYKSVSGIVVRVPHALYIEPGTATDEARIPDVVIPILVADMTAEDGADHPTTIQGVNLVWAPTSTIGLSATPTTGMWIDENYVYLYIAGSGGENVAFVVYVEYTHSIITNEIVTGTYEFIVERQ